METEDRARVAIEAVDKQLPNSNILFRGRKATVTTNQGSSVSMAGSQEQRAYSTRGYTTELAMGKLDRNACLCVSVVQELNAATCSGKTKRSFMRTKKASDGANQMRDRKSASQGQ